MKQPTKLTAKQQRFCEEYLVDFNATQAAIRAGYSVKTANRIAAENLSKLDIQKTIQELQKALSTKTEITREKVVAEYARIAFGDIREFFDDNSRLKPIKDLSDNAAAALAGVDVDELWAEGLGGKIPVGDTKKIKRWDKIKALDGLSRVLGFNAPDKFAQTDVEGNDVKPFTELQVVRILKKLNGG